MSKLLKTTISPMAAIMATIFVVNMAIAGQGDSEEKALHQMEDHWQMVTGEKDPTKRRQLIQEHRKLMDQMGREHGMMGKGRMGGSSHMGMSGNGHHHDVMNTIDMHNSMMDMMEK